MTKNRRHDRLLVDEKSTNKDESEVKNKMTNTELLRKIILSKGLKYSYIAERLNISHQSLIRKIENETEFKAREIKKLCELLEINDYEEKESIFFI